VFKLLGENYLFVFFMGSLFGALLGQLFSRFFSGRNSRAKEIATNRALSLRSPAQKQQYTRVRQTDVMERLNRQDKKIHAKAVKLESQGNIKKAALLFESVRFQRRAIEILEKSGFINEAGQILIRLKATNRAAILFERNNRLERAAHFYQIANMHNEAGTVLRKMAEKDSKYFHEAAECFSKAKQNRRALECFAELLNHDEIYQRSFSFKEYGFLANYMQDYSNAQYIFSKLNEKQIELLITSQALTPRTIQIFSAWVCLDQKPVTIGKVIKHICLKPELGLKFWEALPNNSRQKIFCGIKTILSESRSQSVRDYAYVLATSKIDKFIADSARLFFYNKDYVLAAKNFARVGSLADCKVCLANAGPGDALKMVEECLASNPSGPWNSEIIDNIVELIELQLKSVLKIEQAKTKAEMTRNAIQGVLDQKKTAS